MASASGILNLNEVARRMRQMSENAEKVVELTLKDFKKLAPGWVAQEVRKEYNVKYATIKPKGGRGASVRAQGDTIGTASLVYKGRVLTPVHFGMTPKAPGKSGRYTLNVEIKKGQKKALGHVKPLTKRQRKNIGRNFTRQGTQNSPRSPIMLMPNGGGGYIPFQRRSQRRNDLKAVRTLSMPQMVSNEKVNETIHKRINEELGKKLDHHMQRLMR